MTKLTVVVILNYNGLSDSLACLETLVPQRHPGLELLMVDNASDADPTAAVHDRFPDIPVLRLTENCGWAGGNNAGIVWARERGADVICLLNNDTLIPAGGIDRLSDAARAFGPCLLHPAIDFAEPDWGVQLDPSGWTKPLTGHPHLFPLTYAYGACLVVPVAVFDRIGTFDERFFLQLEETDFFCRAQAAGIPSLCLPAVRIIHAESRSFGARSTPVKTYYIVRNRLLLAEKHDPGISGLIRAARKLNWTIDGLANQDDREAGSLFKTLLWMGSSKPHAVAARRGVFDYLRKRFGRLRNPLPS